MTTVRAVHAVVGVFALVAAAGAGLGETAPPPPSPHSAPVSADSVSNGASLGGLPASSPAVSDEMRCYLQVLDANGHTFLECWDLEYSPPELLWKISAGIGRFLGSPAIGPDESIRISSADGRILAISPDGKVLWSAVIGGSPSENPAIRSDGTIYVGSSDGNVYAMGPDGKTRWKFQTDSPIQDGVGVDLFGTVYAGSADGTFYALGPNGDLRWKQRPGGEVRGIPALSQEDWSIFVNLSNGRVAAITRDGFVRWSVLVGDTGRSSPILIKDGVFIHPDHGQGFVIDPAGELSPSQLPAPPDHDALYHLISGPESIYGLPFVISDRWIAWVSTDGRLRLN